MIVASASIANTSYLALWGVLGFLYLLGMAFAAVRYWRKQGARDAKIDEVLDSTTGAMVRLAAIEKNLKPNGLNTQGVGDVVARTEIAVGELSTKLDQHIGASDEVHASLRRELAGKQNKVDQ